MTVTATDITALIKQGEGLNLEMKACNDSIPRSVWETYSAFANTRGGVILLGITEHHDKQDGERFEISGVDNPMKIVTDFWNIINNQQKVSLNYLTDSDVRIVNINGRNVIHITIPEADYHKKPVYINNNIQNGTYKRLHEGDRHVTVQELSVLMRDSSDDIDSQIIEHYGMDDIDTDSLRNYRRSFDILNTSHAYKELEDKEFLRQIGGYRTDRHKSIEGLTMAGLIMFGKRLPLSEVFPAFRLDYLDLIGIEAGSSLKWNDRLTDDGRWIPNLFNFTTLVTRKLLFTLPSEGRLKGVTRIDGGVLHEAVREAIVNTVTYCDYKLNGVLRIDRRTDCMIFRNPGTLRISRERIYDGDFTLARNRTIQTMFRLIGYGDNIGSGFQKILSAWRTLGYPQPDLKEITDVNEVWLTLPLKLNTHATNSTDSTDISTDSTDNSTRKAITDKINKINSHPTLSELQKALLTAMVNNPHITIAELATEIARDRNAVNYQLKKLREQFKIERTDSTKSGQWQVKI